MGKTWIYQNGGMSNLVKLKKFSFFFVTNLTTHWRTKIIKKNNFIKKMNKFLRTRNLNKATWSVVWHFSNQVRYQWQVCLKTSRTNQFSCSLERATADPPLLLSPQWHHAEELVIPWPSLRRLRRWPLLAGRRWPSLMAVAGRRAGRSSKRKECVGSVWHWIPFRNCSGVRP